jgi:acetyltransferase
MSPTEPIASPPARGPRPLPDVEHRLRDGRRVRLRPLGSQDAALERAFLAQLSDESRYLRFMKTVATPPSERLVSFLTDADGDRHVALACVEPLAGGGERLVGQASFVVDGPGRKCDFGIVVADDWHHTGIAGLLMEHLLRTARERGLATMESIVLGRNRRMLRFVRALGFEVEPLPQDPSVMRISRAL